MPRKAVQVVEAPAVTDVADEEMSLTVDEALKIVEEAEKTVAEAFADLAEPSGDDGSNGQAIVPESTASASVAVAQPLAVEEFSCRFGEHFKSPDMWGFFTERVEFRGLMRTTLQDDMALVRASLVCKRHVELVRGEARANGLEAPWFFKLSDTLAKVKEREKKRAELKAKAEEERVALVRQRMAEEEAMRTDVGIYLENFKAQKEREEEQKKRDSFRKKGNHWSSSRGFDGDGNGRAAAGAFIKVKK